MAEARQVAAPITSAGDERLTAALDPLPDLVKLRSLWHEIGPSQGCSFFTSWDWIDAWLSELARDDDRRLLSVRRGGDVIAIGILVLSRVRPHRRLSRRVLHLHATGDQVADSVRIEQNGLLSREPITSEMYDVVLQCLLAADIEWDELDLQGLFDSDEVAQSARRQGLLVDRQTYKSPRIEFSALSADKPLRDAIPDKKTRYELRRAIADYSGSMGPLHVAEPGSVEEAKEFFSDLVRLHVLRWRQKGPPPFASEPVQKFHQRLIATGFPHGRVRLFRISAGPMVVGYLYVLIHDGMANFYQCGFDYGGLGRRDRPGWLCLQLVIDRLRDEGLTGFDFLCGREPYKYRIATVTDQRVWFRLTRPLAKFRAEKALIDAVRRLRRMLRGIASWLAWSVGVESVT
jgi:CelD/BcsL family acetyltransferase involved in cellulose biosynthesis